VFQRVPGGVPGVPGGVPGVQGGVPSVPGGVPGVPGGFRMFRVGFRLLQTPYRDAYKMPLGNHVEIQLCLWRLCLSLCLKITRNIGVS
jgi:hypothetical protein